MVTLIILIPQSYGIYKKLRNKEIVILEVGVSHGGSLQMWKNYFGEKAKIYGIEVNPNAKEVEEDQIEIFIGSQSDRKFLRSIKQKLPQIDILRAFKILITYILKF